MTENQKKEILINDGRFLPADFENFLESTIDTRYMFFHKNNSKEYLGYCHCGVDNIPLTKPKSGHLIKCPYCGHEVKLKNDIYNHYELHVAVRAYLSKCSNGFIERLFLVYYKTYYNPLASPRVKIEIKYDEEQRSLLFENKKYTIHPYSVYDIYTRDSHIKWLKGRGHKHGEGYKGWWAEDLPMKVYPNFEIFNNSEYQYSAIKEFCEHIEYEPFWYLPLSITNPLAEKLLKLGLYKVVMPYLVHNRWDGSRFLNYYSNDIYTLLGIKSKEDLAFLKKNDLYPIEIKAYTLMKNEWKGEITKDAIHFRAEIVDASDTDFKYDFISFERLYHYYLENQKNYKNVKDFWRDYQDYITAATFLKMNLKDTRVKTPHDFKYCHDLCIARAEEMARKKREREKRKKIRSFSKTLTIYNKCFAVKDKKYTLVVPQNQYDFEEESENNDNCVRTYFDRVLKLDSIVVFLRESSDIKKSFCTVELEPQTLKIVQCRSKGNGPAPEKALKWLKKTIESIKPKYNKLLTTN